ncbi:MAG: AAA family ATPase [Sphingomonas bacterium]|nr:AAA family ATPase [Sphingomonas bacterium]
MRRGFILGKFLPPHAGHVALIEAAMALVDELTILVAWLPGDSISGPLRIEWMRDMFSKCRVVGHGAPAPQDPGESKEYWPIWRSIVSKVHPDPIDYLFAGEAYGAELARQVGGLYVPLGARVLGADQNGLGGLSGSAVRDNPWGHWQFLPAPVRDHYAHTICLHGVESVGKSTLAERLAVHYGTVLVPEYGRAHCETYGTECREQDLLLIGRAQQAMIEAARPWCNRRLIADTDALMTAAWSQMMIGHTGDELLCERKADLYLMLATDAPFIDDGTRVYREPEQRVQFDRVARAVLATTRVRWVEIKGSWDGRFETAVAAIDSLASD